MGGGGGIVGDIVDTATGAFDTAVDIVQDVGSSVVDTASDVVDVAKDVVEPVITEPFRQTLLPTKRILNDIADIRSITDIPKAAADIFVEGFSAPVLVPTKVLTGTTEKVLEGLQENLAGEQTPLTRSLADIGYLLEEGAYERSPVSEFFQGQRNVPTTGILDRYSQAEPVTGNLMNRYNQAKTNINNIMFPYSNLRGGLLNQEEENVFSDFLQQRGLI